VGDVKHGTNPAARRLQERQDVALAHLGADPAICPYEHHRPSDWTGAQSGKRICGVCHPPAKGAAA
jgi:hypothetical protein